MFFSKKKDVNSKSSTSNHSDNLNVLNLENPDEDPENLQERNTLASMNPLLTGYIRKFFAALKNLGPEKKVDLIYKFYAKSFPKPGTPLSKKLNRIIYEQEFGEKIKETDAALKNEKKQFKWPWKAKSEMRASTKPVNKDKILVLFLTITNDLIGPKMYPIYSGNMVIIHNKPYELDPRAVLRFGKFKCIIIKEIDRRPVSNLDLEEVRRRGDSTSSDEFLIKAAMKAIQTAPAKKEINKAVVIGIIIAIAAALIFFFTKG